MARYLVEGFVAVIAAVAMWWGCGATTRAMRYRVTLEPGEPAWVAVGARVFAGVMGLFVSGLGAALLLWAVNRR